eukprot:TRINITY_DN25462_c0_g1_i1.p1 TRINITY_DN25462_c0_g1~~TRINITY_DN25462_c0_g1_i1.p1  ORF type:complete len:449 (+),score=60.15 TRINITY_DN25462_c0_g1_i1:154-1500(+)
MTVETSHPGKERPFLVVLTGGPSSGKSSALALLRDRLSARGFQVLTVPENATHFLANSDGFQPEWAGTDAQVRMQRVFMDFQISQEEYFKTFAELHPTKRAVLLLDCCTINSKVYLSDEQWEKVLAFPGRSPTTEADLFARYDLVVHMKTCALEGDDYEWGPGSNNPGRYHTPEQAKEQDERCLQVFRGHPQLRVVPHCPDFKDKMDKVAEFVNDALQIEGMTGRRRRRTCRIVADAGLKAVLDQDSTSASLVTCTFIDDALRHSMRRRARISKEVWLEGFERWQKQSSSGAVSSEAEEKHCLREATNYLYERRSIVDCPKMPSKSYMSRHVVHEEDYFVALQSRNTSGGSVRQSVRKLVLRFLKGSHYYELIFFLGRQELILDFGAEDFQVPPWLELTGTTDLADEDSSASFLPEEVVKSTVQPPVKKQRILRAHSTEEAFFMGSGC